MSQLKCSFPLKKNTDVTGTVPVTVTVALAVSGTPVTGTLDLSLPLPFSTVTVTVALAVVNTISLAVFDNVQFCFIYYLEPFQSSGGLGKDKVQALSEA